MVALLLTIGLGFALFWQAALRPLARRHVPARKWARGPLEGLVRTMQGLTVPRR